jgi:5-methyltetrahydrofolate--homocysteine methyltransferase
MSEDIIALLRGNVIQGRKTKDDQGIDSSLEGKPGVVESVQLALEAGIKLADIIESISQGMKTVGDKFAAKEFFIPDMLASAEAVAAAMDLLKPYLTKSGVAPKGKFVIATVEGDIHDIGKNIVAIQLRGAGYEVNDLGVDVSPKKITEVVREQKPEFLGLSAMLTTTVLKMGETVRALKESGLRERVKVLIGGAAASEKYAGEIGADSYCTDGFHAIRALEQFQKQR